MIGLIVMGLLGLTAMISFLLFAFFIGSDLSAPGKVILDFLHLDYSWRSPIAGWSFLIFIISFIACLIADAAADPGGDGYSGL